MRLIGGIGFGKPLSNKSEPVYHDPQKHKYPNDILGPERVMEQSLIQSQKMKKKNFGLLETKNEDPLFTEDGKQFFKG